MQTTYRQTSYKHLRYNHRLVIKAMVCSRIIAGTRIESFKRVVDYVCINLLCCIDSEELQNWRQSLSREAIARQALNFLRLNAHVLGNFQTLLNTSFYLKNCFFHI